MTSAVSWRESFAVVRPAWISGPPGTGRPRWLQRTKPVRRISSGAAQDDQQLLVGALPTTGFATSGAESGLRNNTTEEDL
jgi:hypothetical protein